ncbi:unnamed protein product [Miscanthus lutarioriparius]|uniref:Uncharacterized protein n=1 Tax=Miscanthus lutarioriparius TaxID=422564 RepID=A0A811SMN9_9POAL|nr:unnamed protein product [Miscanthus lutarioriparius]
MPLLAAAAAGGCQRLVDLWATAPLAGNWQEPLGQDSGIPPWSSWLRETKNQVSSDASLAVMVIVCWGVHRRFCRDKEDNEQDTSIFVLGPWSNNDDAERVSALPRPPLQEQQPRESGDGCGPQSNSGEEGIILY